jgi:hypothetical protein
VGFSSKLPKEEQKRFLSEDARNKGMYAIDGVGSAEAKAIGLRMLEHLGIQKFAYPPHVLARLHLHREQQKQSEKARAIEERMHREFPDAIEWIECCAHVVVARWAPTFETKPLPSLEEAKKDEGKKAEPPPPADPHAKLREVRREFRAKVPPQE